MSTKKKKYSSAEEHLKAIEDALCAEFPSDIPPEKRARIHKAILEAFDVGHRTTTTDDWCDAW